MALVTPGPSFSFVHTNSFSCFRSGLISATVHLPVHVAQSQGHLKSQAKYYKFVSLGSCGQQGRVSQSKVLWNFTDRKKKHTLQ